MHLKVNFEFIFYFICLPIDSGYNFGEANCSLLANLTVPVRFPYSLYSCCKKTCNITLASPPFWISERFKLVAVRKTTVHAAAKTNCLKKIASTIQPVFQLQFELSGHFSKMLNWFQTMSCFDWYETRDSDVMWFCQNFIAHTHIANDKILESGAPLALLIHGARSLLS